MSRETEVDARNVQPPDHSHFELPERVLQFGTGAFLRGFADVFLDEANRAGLFSGRIVAVASTASSRVEEINAQDGLYTVCFQGVSHSETIDTRRIVGSVSRAISSTESWREVVELAKSPELWYVISNTTEVGIRYDAEDRPDYDPPRSFPGKLTALLHERAEEYEYDPASGLIILCCELIADNGTTLRDIVLRLSDRWDLGHAFTEWIRSSCWFCNTLVDRIVSGTPAPEKHQEFESELGYRDPLLIQAEPYGLWAIEGDENLRALLSFREADPAIVVSPDISPFRIRKVRILNGTHSVMVPISYLCGNDTVSESMRDPLVSRYIRSVMLDEIVPSMDLQGEEVERFAHQVIDRFSNPFVHHELLSIALHQTSKMNVRVVPSVEGFVHKRRKLPERIILGFAAYLVFVLRKLRAAEAGLPADDRADAVRAHHAACNSVTDFVHRVAADTSLWSHPLADVPGFVDLTGRYVEAILRDGARSTLESLIHEGSGQG